MLTNCFDPTNVSTSILTDLQAGTSLWKLFFRSGTDRSDIETIGIPVFTMLSFSGVLCSSDQQGSIQCPPEDHLFHVPFQKLMTKMNDLLKT